MTFWLLFYEFFKTGLFAVGGGMATIPFLYAISEKTGWFTAADIGNMIAISESTPGAIGVNMSTYVGFHVAGIPGAFITTFGLVLPSIPGSELSAQTRFVGLKLTNCEIMT